MELIKNNDLAKVTGGEITPGYPSPETMCTNTKLLVLSGYDKPGFDVSAGTWALMNMCPNDFWDHNMAREYVKSGGGIPVPPAP